MPRGYPTPPDVRESLVDDLVILIAFRGMREDDAARVLGITPRTAHAWLQRRRRERGTTRKPLPKNG